MRRRMIAIALLLVVIIVTACGNRTPKCDGAETLSLVSQLVSRFYPMMVVKKIENIRLIDTKKDAGIVTCEADVQIGLSNEELAQKTAEERTRIENELPLFFPIKTYKYTAQYTTDGKIYVQLYNK